MQKNAAISSQKIYDLLFKSKNPNVKLQKQDLINICQYSKEIFDKEPNVLNLHPPLNIVGDIHGQFNDFIQIFDIVDSPPNSRYLFLGDYVDRGTNSLEVIALLLSLKIKFPNHVYLIRGNHETREMTECYGFMVECQSKHSKDVYLEFINTFDSLPLAATVNNKFFCIHGGLTPDLHTIDQIALLTRPTQIQEHGFLADLVWSDPNPTVDEFAPSERGLTVYWGIKPAQKFMESNGFTKIIRAHQMAENGVDYPFEPDRSVITVFSAPWYAGEHRNKGAFLSVDKNMDITVHYLLHNDSAPPTAFAAPKQDNKKNKGGGKGGKKGKGKKGK